tara:strand:- start:529 stop:789 length:261 start_codon:yes stop_codon:yes gene_type:complete
MSGSAFLGPAFTGARTGSVYQSSLSYGSGKIINSLKTAKSSVKTGFNKININHLDIPFTDKNPLILIAYKVDNIEFSEILEPEPLP